MQLLLLTKGLVTTKSYLILQLILIYHRLLLINAMVCPLL